MASVTDPWTDSMPVAPRPDLSRLAALLLERDYTQHAREYLLAYADAVGSLEGAEYLEPADRADADAILEDAWPPVPPTSHAWDEDRWCGAPSRWTTAPAPGPDDADGFLPDEADEAFYAAWSAAREAELDAAGALMPESFPLEF